MPVSAAIRPPEASWPLRAVVHDHVGNACDIERVCESQSDLQQRSHQAGRNDTGLDQKIQNASHVSSKIMLCAGA
jgi:hypothetical protein